MNEQLPGLEYATPASGKRITALVIVGLISSLIADISFVAAMIMFSTNWEPRNFNPDHLVPACLGGGVIGAITAPIAWMRHPRGLPERIGILAAIIFWLAFAIMLVFT